MTKIKICGLSSEEDIHIVNQLPIDYVGFVFAKSKRQISCEKALQLKSLLSPKIQTVGVFVNELQPRIVNLCHMGVLDAVQLHGEESLRYVEELRKLVTQPFIYAVRYQGETDMEQISQYPVDYLLFDTYVPETYGGSGRLIDYKSLPRMTQSAFLAGGLNTDNVCDVIHKVRPYCVDISSGVEKNGKKDEGLIRDFVMRVKES